MIGFWTQKFVRSFFGPNGFGWIFTRVQGSITENPLSSARGAGWILEKPSGEKVGKPGFTPPFLEEFLLTIVLCFNIKDGKEKHGKPVKKKRTEDIPPYFLSDLWLTLFLGGDASWDPFWMAEFVNQQFAWFFMRSWSNSLEGGICSWTSELSRGKILCWRLMMISWRSSFWFW